MVLPHLVKEPLAVVWTSFARPLLLPCFRGLVFGDVLGAQTKKTRKICACVHILFYRLTTNIYEHAAPKYLVQLYPTRHATSTFLYKIPKTRRFQRSTIHCIVQLYNYTVALCWCWAGVSSIFSVLIVTHPQTWVFSRIFSTAV